MEKVEILEMVRHILITVLKHENFEMRDDLTASDVDGWDSLTHMEIITEIESEFNVKFRLKELNKLKNMATLIELIQSKL
ncbi:MAG TPA: acyl carrier protein [Bacteroidales bacterium]|nr:acyl carrier protein [Bacteroidales bacterium]